MIYVQFGGFTDCPSGWLNYEPSVHLRLSRIPILGAIFRKFTPFEFSDEILIGDIVKGLPLEPNSVDVIYSSHVIEHLSYQDSILAFRNVYKILKPGGLFRFVIPDLQSRCRFYIERFNELKEPSFWLMDSTQLGVQKAEVINMRGVLKKILSTKDHKWMWDEKTLRHALENEGFVDVSRTSFGANPDVMFEKVEKKERFFWSPAKNNKDLEEGRFSELAVEARKVKH